jgi:hypothetical protein
MNTKIPHDPWPAVAYQARHVQIIAVGAGGIGSWAIPHLAWLVWSFNRKWNRAIEPRSASLLIVDFDLVEAKNVERGQHFCPPEIGKPKAEVLYLRSKLAYTMRDDEIAVCVAPFRPSLVQEDENRLTILVGCVDSQEGREQMARCLHPRRASPPRVWWVNANNEDDWGQVYCGNTPEMQDLQGCLHEQVCTRLPAPNLVAPSLLEPEPMPQTTQRYSCGDVTSVVQSHAIHAFMAALVYAYVDPLLNGLPLLTFASYANLRRLSTHSEWITPEGFCRALNHPQKFAPFFL